MFGIFQAHASLDITWQIMRKHCFDSSQSYGFVLFSCQLQGLVSLPENSSKALLFSQTEIIIANGKIANG